MARLVLELPPEAEDILYALVSKIGDVRGYRCTAEISRTRQRPPYWAADGDGEEVTIVRLRVKCCRGWRGRDRRCVVHVIDSGVEGEVSEEALREKRKEWSRVVRLVNKVIELLEVSDARLEGLEAPWLRVLQERLGEDDDGGPEPARVEQSATPSGGGE